MATASTLPLAISRAIREGFFSVNDPGASGTFSFFNKGFAVCEVVTAGAESRALPAATGYAVGQRLLVVLKTAGGTLSITGGEDGTSALATAGDIAEFVLVNKNGTKVWKNTIFDADLDSVEASVAAAEADILGLKQGIRSGTSTAMTDTAAVTAAAVLGGFILGTPVSAATYTLPTPAALVAAIAAYETPAVGQLIRFSVHNAGADADAITMAAGVGGTDEGTLTIAQDITRDFVIVLTNVTAASEAYILYGIG